MRLLQRPFVQTQALSNSLDCIFLSNDALSELRFDQREPIARVAKDHVAWNARLLGNHFDNVLRFDDHRMRLVDFNFHRRGVEPADRFVGQVQVADVLRRHLERGVDSFI